MRDHTFVLQEAGAQTPAVAEEGGSDTTPGTASDEFSTEGLNGSVSRDALADPKPDGGGSSFMFDMSVGELPL